MATCDKCKLLRCRFGFDAGTDVVLGDPRDADPRYWANSRYCGCVGTLTLRHLLVIDSKVKDMKGQFTLKEVLEMAPMDQCVLPPRSPSRQWWRYGWAWGFMERNLADVSSSVREKRYRTSLAMGFVVGTRARSELQEAAHCG